MLSHHPQLAWCNEFEYAVDLIPEQGWPALDSYYDWLENHRIFLATGFTLDRTLDYPHLINSFLIQKRTQTQKEMVGATVHRHFYRLLRIWPDARFIHLMRDARDVARSCISMGWAGNVWTGVERWIEAEKLWESLVQTLPRDRWMEVKYESLITDSPTILTQVCEFLGIDYTPAMLSYAQDTTYSSPDPKLIEQWRRKLSEWEIRLVESRSAEMLAERGYALSNLEPLEVSPWLAKKLKLQDRWAKLLFRIKRFGLGLVIADFLTRRVIPFQPWQKQIQKKMNEISIQYLK